MPMRNPYFPIPVVLAALVAASGCAAGAPGAPSGPQLGAAGVPGFDLRIYPGAEAMASWRAASPYRWVGYYLPAPCHTGTSWLGQRAALAAGGWGMAVLFVGEQDWAETDAAAAGAGERCTRANLTAEHGRAHAAEAHSITAAEGFPAGTVIFLDVEPVGDVSAELLAYVRAWTEDLLAAGRYRPGLYAHASNAPEVHALMSLAAARAGGGDPPLWVVRPRADFDLRWAPAASGVPGADVWQGVLDVAESWGGVTLVVDRNVARGADPSNARGR